MLYFSMAWNHARSLIILAVTVSLLSQGAVAEDTEPNFMDDALGDSTSTEDLSLNEAIANIPLDDFPSAEFWGLIDIYMLLLPNFTLADESSVTNHVDSFQCLLNDPLEVSESLDLEIFEDTSTSKTFFAAAGSGTPGIYTTINSCLPFMANTEKCTEYTQGMDIALEVEKQCDLQKKDDTIIPPTCPNKKGKCVSCNAGTTTEKDCEWDKKPADDLKCTGARKVVPRTSRRNRDRYYICGVVTGSCNYDCPKEGF